MLTIITGTNRPENLTQVFSTVCLENAQNVFTNEPVNHFNLENLPTNFLQENMYGKRTEAFQAIIDTYINPASKFLFVIPEYNGSYPGVLKLFIDSMSPSLFRGKKAAVLGVSEGRAGNLLGIDHLIASLNHIGVATMPQRQPIAGISKLIADNKLIDEPTLELIKKYIVLLNKF